MLDWKSKPRERNHRVLISWVDLCRIQGHNNCSVIYLYYTSTFINCSHLKASQSISHFHPSFFSGGGLLNLINLIKLPNLLIKCKIGSSDSFQLIQIKNIQNRVLLLGSSYTINNKKGSRSFKDWRQSKWVGFSSRDTVYRHIATIDSKSADGPSLGSVTWMFLCSSLLFTNNCSLIG